MRNLRRTIENIFKGAGSLLEIMPPERRVRFSFSPSVPPRYNRPEAYLTQLERDWKDLGGDMRVTIGDFNRTYKP
ncbi:MAG TPA: hypothetical protein VJK07_01580 [Candidatus Nanoarchaeia archaeon]|nr:hypothetical protein [Candidatus Nanoarchaeia archaeon]